MPGARHQTRPDRTRPGERRRRHRGGRRPLAARGQATRRRLLESAERVFAELGYHDASIGKITEAAGVGQGTFYLYFQGKAEIFDELVRDLNRRVRRAMSEAAAKARPAPRRVLGFHAFFLFTAEHPALYRIIRQAEFASPETLQFHYDKLVEGYVAALERAMDAGEVARRDPEVLAWALMGIGELIGMRYILWAGRRDVPQHVLDEIGRIIACLLEPEAGAEALVEPRPPRVPRGFGGGQARHVPRRGAGGRLAAREATPARDAHEAGRDRGDRRSSAQAVDAAAEIAAASGIPEQVILERWPSRQAHRRRRRARQRPLGPGGGASPRRGGRRAGRRRRRRLLRLVVEGVAGLAGRAVDRAPPRLRARVGARAGLSLVRRAGRRARLPRPACGRAGAPHRPRRGSVPRVLSPRLRERAVPLHVQLRRRSGRRAHRRREAPANEILSSARTDGSLSLHVKVPEGGSV